MKIDNLNAVAPRIAKIAAKWRQQFDLVLLCQLFADLLELVFVANHDAEMANIDRVNFVDFENGEKLVFAEFEERVAFTFIKLLEIENILVEGNRLFYVADFDRDVVATVDFNAGPAGSAHFCNRFKQAIISALRSESSS